MRRTLIAVFALGCCALAQEASTSAWDGIYTQEQSKRGESGYAQDCASCHGSALTGGESAPPLMGGEFSSSWNGLTLGDLFERIRTTMPATRPGTLARDRIVDILAYMLAMNRFPAGATPLPRQTEALKTIRIDAEKPGK